MTMENVVIELGSRDFSPGLTFVALSRVRRLAALLLHPFNMDRLIPTGRPSRETSMRRAQMRNILAALSARALQTAQEEGTAARVV